MNLEFWSGFRDWISIWYYFLIVLQDILFYVHTVCSKLNDLLQFKNPIVYIMLEISFPNRGGISQMIKSCSTVLFSFVN